MRPLADAAVCRSESDWLVGINGTRAMTAFNSKSGGFQLTTVGRVQTPTLAILVEREEKIRASSRATTGRFWRDFAPLAANTRAAGSTRNFANPTTIRTPAPSACGRRQGRRRSSATCTGQPGMVSEESKPSTQSPPLLYDLTSLQREANGRFGFSARTTLSLAQALYEKHKVLTYPRTDARALPEDYLADREGDARGAAGAERVRRFRAQVLKQKWVRPNKRIFDNAKISDHFAIIPDAAQAEEPERTRGEALRSRRQALSGSVLPAGRIHADHPDHAGGR